MLKDTSIKFRFDLIQEGKKNLKKNEDLIAEIITKSMGKPLQQSKNELKTMFHRLDSICSMAEEQLEDEIIKSDENTLLKIKKEPYGNLLLISPWNYPLICLINNLVTGILYLFNYRYIMW